MNNKINGQIDIFMYMHEKKLPKEVEIKGFMDDGFCPNCNACMEDLVEECPYCDCKLLWNNWRRINLKENENEKLDSRSDEYI